MNRAARHPVTEWWWTVDRLMFGLAAALIVAGVVMSFAASPAVAERIGLDGFHFAGRQIVFAAAAILVMTAVSFLDERSVRRAALLVLIAALVGMSATLLLAPDVKGARRWIDLGPMSLQPSEFAKPALAVLSGWLFAEGGRRSDAPGFVLAWVLVAIIVGLLLAQPDFGQALLILLIWGGVYFVAGMPRLLLLGLAGVGLGGGFAAYSVAPHVARRIDRFLDPSSGDTFQIDRAIGSFVQGGWFGAGPGEGTMKRMLPDSHTDFVFAVLGEEFGAAACLVLVGIFALLTLRGLAHAFRTEDMFRRLAICGLALLFGLQSAINFAVNLNLLPAKGMTLPFISYGGSSLLASAFAMGLLLALTRQRADPVPFVDLHAEPEARPA